MAFRAEFGVISEKVKQDGGDCVIIRKLGEVILKHRIVTDLHGKKKGEDFGRK